MNIKRITALLTAALALVAALPCAAQNNDTRPEEEVVKFEEKVHDFGDLLITDKSVSCKFVFTNISKKPVVVHNVVSSCGCTVPKWTKEPVKPGAKGSIEVTFKNDQGAYPFSKSITAYISGVNRPVVLHIKGVVYGKKMSLKEMYTNTIGGVLGTRETTLLIGNMYQGKAKSDATSIANLSKAPVKVQVVSEDPALSVAVVPNPVPAGDKASLTYTVNTANGEKKWGKTEYSAKFIVDGKPAEEKIKIVANIADDFDGYTQSMKEKAPVPGFVKGYLDLGEVSKGTIVDHTFTVKNTGKSQLIVYKVDSDDGRAEILTKAPIKIAPGKSADVKIKYDTSTQTGEFVSIVTLTTNSPLRPRLDFFINGSTR
ncbi:MAG: DUF1573 domain-containing protein [Bacteroidales bacterium]|nr:DUF1573 domain-containing protein [Bacteroidales bacterium]